MTEQSETGRGTETQSLTGLEQELILFLRELEIEGLRPFAWGDAPHRAANKLDELAERGLIQDGSQRYSNDGDRYTWKHQYETPEERE